MYVVETRWVAGWLSSPRREDVYKQLDRSSCRKSRRNVVWRAPPRSHPRHFMTSRHVSMPNSDSLQLTAAEAQLRSAAFQTAWTHEGLAALCLSPTRPPPYLSVPCPLNVWSKTGRRRGGAEDRRCQRHASSWAHRQSYLDVVSLDVLSASSLDVVSVGPRVRTSWCLLPK